jgi:hypothetical protein
VAMLTHGGVRVLQAKPARLGAGPSSRRHEPWRPAES